VDRRARSLRRLAGWLLVAGLIAALHSGEAMAQSGIQVLENDVPEFTFGESMSFELHARLDEPIEHVTLFIQPATRPPMVLEPVSITQGRDIRAMAHLDLNLEPLPPYSHISWWWVLTDTASRVYTTEPAGFFYDDNRFSWNRVSRGLVTVHWYRGDEAFGRLALEAATEALSRGNREIRAPLPERLDIYIYADTADMRAALGRVGRTWADGHADPAMGVVVVTVAADLGAELNLARIVPHELSHVLIYKATAPNAAYVPTWLNEGLALINQARSEPGMSGLLAAARDSGRFLELQDLCGPFETRDVALAYAQSESIVAFIRQRWGSEGIHRLIGAYAGAADCGAGVELALGVSLDELEGMWLSEVIFADRLGARLAEYWPWLTLGGLVLAGPLIFLALAYGRRLAH
jgi:hypothetical protein